MLEQIATHAIALMAGGTVGVMSMAVLTASKDRGDVNEHAWKLGRKCWLRTHYDRWIPCRVVGVSHKGALNLREWDDDSGRNAFWVGKEQATDPSLVSFVEPEW